MHAVTISEHYSKKFHRKILTFVGVRIFQSGKDWIFIGELRGSQQGDYYQVIAIVDQTLRNFMCMLSQY